MGVTDLHWRKALLLNLYEHGFAEVSDIVREQVHMYSNSFHTTVLLERGFNFCREASKQSKRGAFGAQAVWHTLLYGCNVLADHDRPALAPTELLTQEHSLRTGPQVF